MSDLVVIVPSRGRPHTVAEIVDAFDATCRAETNVLFALDRDDDRLPAYEDVLSETGGRVGWIVADNTSMVGALNRAATYVLADLDAASAKAIAFIGDDHRPRTPGWDRAYLDALAAKPGIVYGNDLIQGELLPTQCAMSTEVIRALGHMAPPVLTHLYVDDYWRDLGNAAGCLTYLPDVVIEHVHPASGKVAMDEGYRRVNAPEMYEQDSTAYRAYMTEHGARDAAAVRRALATVTA